ncbi:hypothetical protein CGLAUT_11165 [Corynebacterium glaucum]|uniref:hypothetical protein n=1 Tax=Corynebacterium glaucum TaxID=187491 RepID=UPI0025B2DCCD|nr:hypothetical protein [Corynebacterium glaucum]WJZ08688.1 hypothetical protein CGLAUT_11165 [Corynebacterium glaucum]
MGVDAGLKAYGALLVLAVTWPFLVPAGVGEAFALRDMLVFDQMALTRASLGYGDLAARNVPQDALLGIVPWPMLALRMIMVGAAIAAAVSAYRLSRSSLGKAAAMTVLLWNPFVIERLLQGHWSLVAAAWLLPAVAFAPPAQATLAHWLASLTPTGAIAAATFARGWRGILTTALTCAPWVVAGLLTPASATSSAASAALFAPRAETFVGTLGALLGLGGIWNADAVPESRNLGFALFGIGLFAILALGWRAVNTRWLVLAGIGFAIALASWAGLLAPLIETVPGAGLLRDSQKWLILTLPACTAAAGALTPKLAGTALLMALLQVPDAPLALRALTPTAIEFPAIDHRGRDVFFVDRPALIDIGGRVVVDPAPKAMNAVESGLLLVDGTVADPPSPRWLAAQRAQNDLEALKSLGIGVVVYPDGDLLETGAEQRGLPPLGIALFALWCAAPLFGVTRITLRKY